MAEKSAIAWTKSTFNPWIGCSRIGPGCDNCYAAVSTPARTRKIAWGAGENRQRTSIHNWNQPLRWNREAPESEFAGRKGFWPVFCASLADVFDNEVPEAWRDDLWALIKATPNLTWQLVTKRIGNVVRMLPADWGKGYSNVWLIITVVNQDEADRDIPKLLRTPAKLRGISYEPALGPVNWWPWIVSPDGFMASPQGPVYTEQRGIDWIIIGGESDQAGVKARAFSCEWAERTIELCWDAGVAVFVKQLGSNVMSHGEPLAQTDRAGGLMDEWPPVLLVREFPI